MHGKQFDLRGAVYAKQRIMAKTSGNIRSVSKRDSSSEARTREGYERVMKPLLKKNIMRYVGNDEHIKINFTMRGNKHIVNDVLKGKIGLTKKDLSKLDSYLKNAKYEGLAGLKHPRKDNIVKFYYFKDRNKSIYYNVAEARDKLKNGRETIHRFLYAVTKEIQ